MREMKNISSIEAVSFNGLSDAMESRLEKYFELHDGLDVPSGLYDMIIKEIEKSIILTTMKYAGGNKLKASKILGINRNTLHKKLVNLELNDEF